MIQIVKILNGEPVMLVDEKELQVPSFVNDPNGKSAERAFRCQQARNFKAELAKAEEHEQFLDATVNTIGDIVLNVFLLGLLAIALYFGS